jgi:hypothetical protein
MSMALKGMASYAPLQSMHRRACLIRIEQMQVDARDGAVAIGVDSIEHFLHTVLVVLGRRLHTRIHRNSKHITVGCGFVAGTALNIAFPTRL